MNEKSSRIISAMRNTTSDYSAAKRRKLLDGSAMSSGPDVRNVFKESLLPYFSSIAAEVRDRVTRYQPELEELNRPSLQECVKMSMEFDEFVSECEAHIRQWIQSDRIDFNFIKERIAKFKATMIQQSEAMIDVIIGQI